MVDDSGGMLRVDQFIFGPRLHEQRLLSRMEKRAVVLSQQSTLVVDLCQSSNAAISLLVGIVVLGPSSSRRERPDSLGRRDCLPLHNSWSFPLVDFVAVAN